MDVGDLCRLCHPAAGMHHLPDAPGVARVKKAILEKRLPGRDGDFLCTTCHKTHDSTYTMRQAYAETIWEGRVPDPHGSRMLCFACHTGRIREGEEVRFVAGRDNIKLCNGCHTRPGVKKAPHVVEVTSSEGTWRMDYLGYPLNQGKLICVTCHDEVSHGKPDSANPNFLRGGPYADVDKFCYRCHLEDKEVYNNPHRQVDGFGRIRTESCRFCHRNDPDPGKKTPGEPRDDGRRRRPMFRLPPDPSPPRGRSPDSPEGGKSGAKDGVRGEATGSSSALRRRKDHVFHLPQPPRERGLKGEAGIGGGSKWRVPDFREVCAPCHGRY